ncbi:MAG: class I SAM-dependent methyltransferase [Patescibacteria group bacterium]
MAEFDGIRAKLYAEALTDFPQAREGDIELMKKYLCPNPREVILEVGAGNGLFSGVIADALLPEGRLIVTDPSSEQLHGVADLNRSNIEIRTEGTDTLILDENSVGAIWSFGAMHHVFNKTTSFKNFFRCLKSGGRIVISDVFSGSTLAKHFDDRVAKFCATGHEVVFWSREYAESLCFLTGFGKPEFHDFNAKWVFNKKEDIGVFLYKLHAMTKTTEEECLSGAEKILGIAEEGGKFYLNWPMTMMIIKKL